LLKAGRVKKNYNFLPPRACALEIGNGQIGIADFKTRRERFIVCRCGEGKEPVVVVYRPSLALALR